LSSCFDHGMVLINQENAHLHGDGVRVGDFVVDEVADGLVPDPVDELARGLPQVPKHRRKGQKIIGGRCA